MHELPPMKPLVLVLKIFLQQREFNEVGHLHLAFQLGCRAASLHRKSSQADET